MSLRGGITLSDVEAKTGFPLYTPSPTPVSPAPTERELALLRGSVREELENFYPEYVRAQA